MIVYPNWFIKGDKGDQGIQGEQGPPGPAAPLSVGSRSSATDAGVLNEMSADDDYIYVCTTAGTAGNAVWKRTPLFLT